LFVIANLGVANMKADEIILKTYGNGELGFIRGAVEMIIYPLADINKAIGDFPEWLGINISIPQ